MDEHLITLDDQIRSVGREIGLRRSVYPRFVANKKLTQEKADYELACMEATYSTLKKLKAEQQPTKETTSEDQAGASHT